MEKVDLISPEEGLAAAKAWLAGVDVGDAMHHRNLTVFPLFREEVRDTDNDVGEEKTADRGVGRLYVYCWEKEEPCVRQGSPARDDRDETLCSAGRL